ncbi:hypothetical protein LOTGIDRAFT_105898 [Lottia gigantea]|uniref:Uncharacterized protein n=1 Tax=Lottia gigantea TaxID=225164 RepID=V4BL68_LOTGI|nr:hypothetical protein LOTGIDRAFT_105898 [Lottia gigantea]ESO89339.1 hypothetical protein LOTGIDRAFT_105898 [Lottia gigantea]
MAKPPPDPIFILRGSISPVSCLHAPAHSLDILYCGNQSGQITVWNLKSRRVTCTIEAHVKSTVLWLQSLNEKELLSQGRDGLIKLWTYENERFSVKTSFKCSSQTFCCSALFEFNKIRYLVLPNEQQSVIDIVNIKNSQLMATLKPTDQKYGMCMCVNNSYSSVEAKPLLLIGYENGSIILWDILAEKVLDRLDMFLDSIMCLDFSSQLLKGLCGSVNNTLKTFRITKEMKLIQDKELEVTNDGFSNIIIRNDNKLVVTTGWDSTIRLFSMKSWKPLAVLKYHKESVQCATFISNNILICGSKDKLISLWNIYT